MQCRICLAYEDDRVDLIAPCACTGSGGLVHRACLERWQRQQIIDSGLNPSKCTTCNTDYKYRPTFWRAVVFSVRAGILFVATHTISALQLYTACLATHVLSEMPARPSVALLKTVAANAGETFETALKMFVVLAFFAKIEPWANRLDKMLRTTMANNLGIPEVVDNGWTPEPEPPAAAPAAPRYELRSLRAPAP